MRQGQAEVIFCQGKTPAQIVTIVERLLEAGANVLATRATPDVFAAVQAVVPLARYNEATAADTRTKLLGDLQRQIAKDSVNVFLFQLPQFSVAKAGLKGLWSSSPVFANDLSTVAWR